MLYSLEAKKGEVLAFLQNEDCNFIEFMKLCKSIEEEYQTNDVLVVKGVLTSEFGFKEVIINGKYEVVKSNF